MMGDRFLKMGKYSFNLIMTNADKIELSASILTLE